jgi:hypothetical protein
MSVVEGLSVVAGESDSGNLSDLVRLQIYVERIDPSVRKHDRKRTTGREVEAAHPILGDQRLAGEAKTDDPAIRRVVSEHPAMRWICRARGRAVGNGGIQPRP